MPRQTNLLLFALFCLTTITGFCQESAEPEEAYTSKKLLFGFQMGFEGGFLSGTAAPSDTARTTFTEVNTKPGVGASFGMSFLINSTHKFAFRPGVAVAILPTKITYRFNHYQTETQILYHLSSEINLHFLFRNPAMTNKGSFIIGPSAVINMPALSDGHPKESAAFPRADLGFTKPLKLGVGFYILDLFYGYGLTSTIDSKGSGTYDQWYKSLNRHQISLRLHLY
ncbi:MAG: hypothetical protein GC193_00030 [Cryomorphaceae bacterium]|nr:hypothetical protein [Cryomorphaceae bacterium]